jgi:hypothetical protein
MLARMPNLANPIAYGCSLVAYMIAEWEAGFSKAITRHARTPAQIKSPRFIFRYLPPKKLRIKQKPDASFLLGTLAFIEAKSIHAVQ